MQILFGKILGIYMLLPTKASYFIAAMLNSYFIIQLLNSHVLKISKIRYF